MDAEQAGRRGATKAAPPPFVRVAPSLFLGSANAAAAPELLERAGVTLCVNVSRQQPGPRAPGVTELRVPVFDDPAEDLLAHLEPTCAAMEAAVRAGGACLVYCKNGRSRSAAVCTAYLIRHRGLSRERAFQVGRGFRREEAGPSGRGEALGRGGAQPVGRGFEEGPLVRAGPPGVGNAGGACSRRCAVSNQSLSFADCEERPPGGRAQPGLLVPAPEVRGGPSVVVPPARGALGPD